MTGSMGNFRSELRMPAGPAAAAVMGASLLVIWYTKPHPLLMPLAAVAAVALLIDAWQPRLSAWLLLLALVASVTLAVTWQGLPEALALFFVPVGLAAALVGLAAAAAVAGSETFLLYLIARGGPAVAGTGMELAALAGIWATFGLMWMVYHPVTSFVDWSWDYYRRARVQLDEALDRKVALEQALADLTLVSRQLALSNDRLAALRSIAEEAQQTKAAFVAKVSHEFRTPLNMIIGLVDLMVKSPEIYGKKLPRSLIEDLSIVQRNCEHLSGMIDDVLDLSQVEAGRLTLHRERIRLAEVSQEALAVVQPLLRKKGLAVQVFIPDDLPEVYCDRTRIRQVILNLLSNAARFTETGSITLRMATEANNVKVSITDTGPGISPGDVERIFEPFCQGSQPLWRDKGGSGLGLSISKQFVELHGGRIWLESEVGRGTSFHFELPVSEEIEPVARPTRWLSEEWVWHERDRSARLPDLSPAPRVIVCDGSGDLQAVLARFPDEMELVDCADLAQAAAAARDCPAHVAIVNTGSTETLWPMVNAARHRLAGTPVVGCIVPSHARQMLGGRALDYLVKPVTRPDIEEALHKVSGPVRSILLVDDEPEVLMLWTRMLRMCDSSLEIRTASTGEDALAALRTSQPGRLPDLLFLDIVLPDMSGWEVLRRKNEDPALAGVAVILVTAQDPSEEPLRSQGMLVTLEEGITLRKLLRCSIATSAILLGPG